MSDKHTLNLITLKNTSSILQLNCRQSPGAPSQPVQQSPLKSPGLDPCLTHPARSYGAIMPPHVPVYQC
ncbi:hypothetical protein CROQUDRAFT_98256 [Cronartium quercuum f. sp. fusiforme G11]|uniref:Uncharacterized protein n=1 Tax=Cronartium quercuum f. sp. fusiforme G11 TaxID=708437 RepID=A0A9P6T7T7_9BASI|nr:hypothetical protein CROQUDRAFT_98256 [Cronartium quercuum f. sp. fusiforme G11]